MQRNRKTKKKNVPKRTKTQSNSRSAASAIARGLSGVANQFIPGAGGLVTGVARLFGAGAYTTAQADQLLASRVPEMHATLDRGVRISHHEYLGDVKSSELFTTTSYPINPGMVVTFPWLSAVAAAFQEWELLGCIFYFKSTSANALNSVNTALGQVIGATQYNPYQPAPSTKIEMLGLASAADGKPSESNIYPIECKSDMNLFRSKLVRFGTVTDDLAKYDHGNFFLGTNGSQAAATVGELHIVYDVILKKPKLWSTGGGSAWFSHYHNGSNVVTATPIGTVDGASFSANNLGVLWSNGARLTIPGIAVVAGTKYSLVVTWTGSSAVTVSYPTITYSNAALATDIWITPGSVAGYVSSPASGSSAIMTLRASFVAAVSNIPIDVTFGAATIPTSSAVVDLVISESL